MDIDTEELVERAKELRALGVVEFSAGPYTVKFGGVYGEPRTVGPAEPQASGHRHKGIRELAEERWGKLDFPGNG
jgi:hypothetical protein